MPTRDTLLRLSAGSRNLLTLAILGALSAPVWAQASNSTDDTVKLDTVNVTGSRASNRSATETAVPVDIITREMIDSTGAVEVGRLLQKIAPSFNFPQSFVSDGTDLIWPASLRGMGPDQVLVLVNGKRRHQQGLVNVQQSIGRGSAGTDINTIPISAIERIEILRDGASAQYGSDAIAGVINIILKNQGIGGNVSTEVGQFFEGDGETTRVGANIGLALGEGSLNLTAEYLDRGETNRAGPDVLRVSPARVTQRIGDADTQSKLFWLNAEIPVGEASLYAFGGTSTREGNSSGFFRSSADGRTVPALYPNGFLPTLLTTTDDWSFAVGLRGAFNDTWDYDVSVNRGHNAFNFAGANTVNVSWYYEPTSGGGIQANSPNSSNSSGRLSMDQTTLNFDTKGSIDWGIGNEPLYLAVGLEWREDGYQIEAGDPVSWSYGRSNNPAIVIRNQNGGTAAAGLQGFPGFQPSTEVDESRNSLGLYVEGESYMTERLLVGAALRFEDYSDAGKNATGKINLRYNVNDAFSWRGAISTGFRAPGVQQQFFSQVSTTLSGGALIDSITARQGSVVANQLGFAPLEEETSTDYTFGFAYRPDNGFTLTVDAYRIDIDDRIVLSGDISAGYSTAVGNILTPLRVGSANLFTNAIDTRTSGIDVVGQYAMELDGGSNLVFDLSWSHNKTSVQAIHSQSSLLPSSVIFPEAQVILVEEALPRNRAGAGVTWNNDTWTIGLSNQFYGQVRGVGFGPEYKGDSQWLTDLIVTYKVNDSFDISVGGNNIFDTYPTKWAGGDNPGVNPFPGLGFLYGWETLPFGLNGGYYYGRINWKF